MRGLLIWLPLMLFLVATACDKMNPLRVPLRCEHFGFSIQIAFLEVRKCDSRLLFCLTILFFIEINFDFQ